MTLALAPEPARATQSVTISFGLLSIPVSLYSAHQVTRTARHEYVKGSDDEWNAVGRQSFNKVTGEAVDKVDVVKMVTVADGTLVEVDDAAYAAATGAAALSGRLDVQATVPLDSLWSIFDAEGSAYQVRAQRAKKVGANAAGEKGLALLLRALADSEVAAIGRTALRGGEVRLVALTPDGMLRLLRPVDSVRKAKALPAVALSDGEVTAATALVESIGTLDIEAEWLSDIGAAEVAEAAAHAASLGAGARVGSVEGPSSAAGADDMMAALEASVAAVKAARKGAA